MIEKICIGTVGRAWNPLLTEDFVDSMARLLLYSQQTLCRENEFIHYTKGTVSYHETMRNELVDNSLGEWILQLDTDHIFAPDLLERLLYLRAKYNTKVLSAIYTYKVPPHGPVANVWGPNGEINPLTDWDPDAEVIEIGPCGGGALLVDRDVYKLIADKCSVPPFSCIQGLSEDYSFFKRCRDLGIPTHLAVNVEAHHILPARQITSVKRPRKYNKAEV